MVYLGAAVLVGTAVKMITGEALLQPWLKNLPMLGVLAYLTIPLVLWAGFAKNHRRLESRIHARLAEFAKQFPQGAGSASTSVSAVRAQTEGEKPMLKVLVPVDGSPNALLAVRHAIAQYRRDNELELHLLNVQPSLSRHIARFVSRDDRDAWHRDQAEAALASSRAVLTQAGVPFHSHWVVGDRVQQICRNAESLSAHHIVIGTARKNSITRMLEASVTSRMLEASPVPVEVVAGDAVSKWEQWGLPAGVLGGAGGLLFWALD